MINKEDQYGTEQYLHCSRSYHSCLASDILTKYHPIMKETHAPLCVTGDGICLFRAVFLPLHGNENYHVIIRTLAAIELIENRRHDYEHEQFVNHFNDERIVFDKYADLTKDVNKFVFTLCLP